MLKRMNKRGQGLSTETLIITLLAVGVGILVIVGFTVGWDKMIGFFKKTDIDITLISENCEIAAGQGAAGFCSNKMMISSKNYVNCPYAIEKLGVKINSQQPTCDELASAKAICEKLKLEQGDSYDSAKYKINDKTCKDWIAQVAVKTCKAKDLTNAENVASCKAITDTTKCIDKCEWA